MNTSFIIGIAGNNKVGKSTLANRLKHSLQTVYGINVTIFSFAAIIKAACIKEFSLPLNSFDHIHKNLLVPDSVKTMIGVPEETAMTYRELLFYYLENQLVDRVSVEWAFFTRNVKALSALRKNYDIIIIDDVRMSHEMEYVVKSDKDSILIHINGKRDGTEDYTNDTTPHPQALICENTDYDSPFNWHNFRWKTDNGFQCIFNNINNNY